MVFRRKEFESFTSKFYGIRDSTKTIWNLFSIHQRHSWLQYQICLSTKPVYYVKGPFSKQTMVYKAIVLWEHTIFKPPSKMSTFSAFQSKWNLIYCLMDFKILFTLFSLYITFPLCYFCLLTFLNFKSTGDWIRNFWVILVCSS